MLERTRISPDTVKHQGIGGNQYRVKFAVDKNEALLICQVSFDRVNFRSATCLLDTGATVNIVRADSPLLEGMRGYAYKVPKTLLLADGTTSSRAMVKEFAYATFKFEGAVPPVRVILDIADVGGTDIILGGQFFKENRVVMDWDTNEIEFPKDPTEILKNPLRHALGEDNLKSADNEEEQVERRYEYVRHIALKTPNQHPEEVLARDDLQEAEDEEIRNGFFSFPSKEETMNEIIRFRKISSREDDHQEPPDVKDFDYLGDEDDWEDMEAEEILRLVPPEFHDYLDVFRKSKADELPPRRSCDHKIKLVEGAQLRAGPVYRLTTKEDLWLQGWIVDQVRFGHLRQSVAPHSSPVFVIAKKDNNYRVVTDFRLLNAVTVKDATPLPRIDTIVDRLANAKVFISCDLPRAFQLIRMAEGHEHFTTLRHSTGQHESLVLRDGLCNAPATFQGFLNEVFRSHIGNGVVVYMDDIAVYGATKEDVRKKFIEVLELLRKNSLYLKPSKCFFYVESINFLGYVISKKGLEMQSAKVDAVRNWPEPTDVKGIQRFLGFANFYRKFVQDYAKITKPLTDLIKKDTPFVWTEAQQGAFEELKRKFTMEPVLKHYDRTKVAYLETDASDFAISAILSQLHEVTTHGVTDRSYIR
jgi:hypothetical protein